VVHLDQADVVECVVSNIGPVGTYNLSASFSGDAFYAASTTTQAFTVQPAPTILAATPAVLSVQPLQLHVWTLHATLKTHFHEFANNNSYPPPLVPDEPVAGKVVDFIAAGNTVCQAVTDSGGNASCSALTVAGLVGTLLSNGYEALFPGDTNYGRTLTTAPLTA
jgi:hypothetical protein